MMFKNIIFALLLTLGALPIVAQTPEKMSNKDIALKAAKILGYTAELSIAMSYLIILEKEDNFALNIRAKFSKGEYPLAMFNLGRRVPFLSAIGHSVYGLCTELQPFAQPIVRKLKNSNERS